MIHVLLCVLFTLLWSFHLALASGFVSFIIRTGVLQVCFWDPSLCAVYNL